MDLLTASMGSVVGNTFNELTNPKATFIAQKRIEAKQDLLLDKVENLEWSQLSMSLALNSNKNDRDKVALYPPIFRSIKAEKNPRLKRLVEIELKEEWIDRNFYWVAPVMTIGILYIVYRLLPIQQKKEVA